MHSVSVAKAKRALSRLVNMAAFGRIAIVLTSRGRPKAVLVEHEEFVRPSRGTPQRVIRLGG
jgi:prevent-host-death family protein